MARIVANITGSSNPIRAYNQPGGVNPGPGGGFGGGFGGGSEGASEGGFTNQYPETLSWEFNGAEGYAPNVALHSTWAPATVMTRATLTTDIIGGGFDFGGRQFGILLTIDESFPTSIASAMMIEVMQGSRILGTFAKSESVAYRRTRLPGYVFKSGSGNIRDYENADKIILDDGKALTLSATFDFPATFSSAANEDHSLAQTFDFPATISANLSTDAVLQATMDFPARLDGNQIQGRKIHILSAELPMFSIIRAELTMENIEMSATFDFPATISRIRVRRIGAAAGTLAPSCSGSEGAGRSAGMD